MLAEIIAHEKKIKRMSVQAIGNAVGHNPISIIIPCHRVLGKDGSLTNYAGGIERKEKLLLLEQKTFPFSLFHMVKDSFYLKLG